jgi:membrane-associated phospholipid phosphatase
LIFALINRFDFPVYMGYAIEWEYALLGRPATMPHVLQELWLPPGHFALRDYVMLVVYGTHFVYFLAFGVLVWWLKREHFPRFKTSILLVLFLGLIGYAVVPTVPPWMAAQYFDVIAPISHRARPLYDQLVPTLHRMLDTNPVAAMPSLDAAFPGLVALFALDTFGRRAWATVVYAGLVFFAIMYLGEHYLVDVVAGVALAGLCYLLVRQWGRFGTGADRARRIADQGWSVRASVIIMTTLSALALGINAWASRYQYDPFVPTMTFVERELDGRTHTASFFRGYRAYLDGDYAQAEAVLARAAQEGQRPGLRTRAVKMAAAAAYEIEDWAAVIRYLQDVPLIDLGVEEGLRLVEARLGAGERSAGLETLDALIEYFPDASALEERKQTLESTP